MKFKDIYNYHLGVHMYKNIGNFESSFRVNPYQTRSGDYYAPGLHRLTLTQNQSIQYQGPIVWEEIPLPIS